MRQDRDRVSRAAVILFAGDERAEGRRKHLPAAFLRVLHRLLLRRLRAGAGFDLLLACELAEPGSDESLGTHVERALKTAFERGYETVAIAAADVPGLTSAHLRRAIAAARGNRGAAVGTSADGGFYAAAFFGMPPVSWNALPLQTPTAWRSLSAALREAGWQVQYLPSLDDVDCESDARRLASKVNGSVAARLCSLLPFVHSQSSRVIAIPTAMTPHPSLRAPPSSAP